EVVLGVRVAHDPLPVDEEQGTSGQDISVGPRDQDAVRFRYAAARIGKKREGKLQRIAELLVRVHRIGGDAKDLHAGLHERLMLRTEALELGGSAAGEVLRIEGDQDGLLPAKARELHLL